MNKNQNGIKNPNYKDGKCVDTRCIDCNKKIHPQATRCRLCEDKHHSELMKGKISKIKGIRYKIYYCKICNTEIMQETSKRSGMCVKCWYEFLSKNKDKHPRFGHIMKPTWIKYSGTWMRSNWEMVFAQYLDKQKIKWQYEPKTFNLGNTTYTPDFYLPEINIYIEVKGYKSDIFKNKIKLFYLKFSGIHLEVIDKERLIQLKLINKRGDKI
jgi:hypothetical protein